jgi:hypothetical protein
VLLWVALVATVAAPVVLNAVNLYRLSVDRLGLTGPAALALPVTLDCAALVALIVRLRALREGDSAPGASVAVVVFAGLSAWLAAVEGWVVGGVVGAVALGVLPIVAVTMLDLAVASVRRADLRAAGLLPGRAPVYSGLRWALAPASTARAWRHGVLWENPDRHACLTATHPNPLIRITHLPPTGPAGTTQDPPGDTATHPAGEVTATADVGAPATHPGRVALPSTTTAQDPARDASGPTLDPVPDTRHPDGRDTRRAGAGPVEEAWTGTKRDLVRSLIRVGYLDRVGIVAECQRRGVDVSAREVTRVIREATAPRRAKATAARDATATTARTAVVTDFHAHRSAR